MSKSIMNKKRKPTYLQVEKAVRYRVLLDDLVNMFQESNMPVVSKRLKQACREIDGIWQLWD